MNYPKNAGDVLRDITWKEWVAIIAVSAFIAWAALFPFVDFLSGVK